MKRFLQKSVAVVVLASALLMLTTVVASAYDLLKWRLDTSAHSVSGQLMDKGEDQDGTTTFGPGAVVFWLAENAAACDVTFPGGEWIICLETSYDWDKGDIALGQWDPDTSQWHGLTTVSDTNENDSASFFYVYITTSGSETIYEGNYLALRVTNNSGSFAQITTDGGSYLMPPDDSPEYPLPEIATGILLGIGLGGLGLYIFIRHKRVNTVTDR